MLPFLAEGKRFELSLRYKRKHDFQSCALSRSANPPKLYSRMIDTISCHEIILIQRLDVNKRLLNTVMGMYIYSSVT